MFWIEIYFVALILLRKIAISHPICTNSKIYDEDIKGVQAFYKASDNTEYWYPKQWNYNDLCDHISYVPEGIYFNSNGRINVILLNTNNISGTIPSQLSFLVKLNQLYLQENQLYGYYACFFGVFCVCQKKKKHLRFCAKK